MLYPTFLPYIGALQLTFVDPTRLVPIMLLKLLIILLSNAPKFSLLCSKLAQLSSIMPQFCSKICILYALLEYLEYL